MRTPQSSMTGYTLIELAVVVSVIGVLAAASFPMMSNLQRSSRLNGATNTLVADIHHARSLATMKRKTYQISFSASAYTIFQVTPADTVRRRALPRDVVCVASDTATFFAWGLTDPVTITIASGGTSNTVQVAVNGSVSHD